MASLAAATTPIIRLRDNWVVIDPALARKARKRVSTGSAAGTWKPVPPVAALRASLTGVLDIGGEELRVHPGASLLKVRDRVVDASTVAPLDPPPGLEATLRDYQLRGLTWLAELTGAGLGACLADDMGLGKTVTLIALHLHRRDRRLASGPTLVVCPASLLGNWEAEIRRFAPGVAGPAVPRRPQRVDLGPARRDGFVLTTYGTMRRDHETLATVPWDLVVADEAQHIKNATSSTARNLRAIGSRCRVALTGTPVENNLTELWAILDWATPGLLGSRSAVPQGVGRADRERGRPGGGAPVRAAGRAVPAAPPQVRPRHRARAAAEDRDRPGGRPDPRAGGALRVAGPRVDGADRARRRGTPAAASCSPCSPA